MGFLWSQLFVTPDYPKYSFTGKTAIVTGSNIGLGLEAARHLARLDAKKVILAVRNMKAGEEAKASIEKDTSRPGVCEVWNLDLSSSESVKAFVDKAKQLDRLDVVLENAGIATDKFRLVEGNESTLAVNVVSTFLLACLILPKLQETATKFNTQPILTIVCSEVHGYTDFPERSASSIFGTLNDEKTANMSDRYNVSKLLELLVIREIAPMIAKGKNKGVTLNTLNPGLCHSGLARESGWGLAILKFFLARTTEVGSRTLVHAAGSGPETHGMYMSDGIIHQDEIKAWVKTEEGDQVGKKVWGELKEKLENIQPGVTKNIE